MRLVASWIGVTVLVVAVLAGVQTWRGGSVSPEIASMPSPPGTIDDIDLDIAQEMSIDRAYRAIPHARTHFRPDSVRMEGADAAYLHALFSLTDVATVERVQTQIWLRTRGQRGEDAANHPRILAELDRLRAPGDLTRAHDLIRDAVDEQGRYLERWRESGEAQYFSAKDPLVRSAHTKLIDAYRLLMDRFPGESARTKQAFFDHLCALDFI